MSNDDCEKYKFKCLTLDNTPAHTIKYSCVRSTSDSELERMNAEYMMYGFLYVPKAYVLY